MLIYGKRAVEEALEEGDVQEVFAAKGIKPGTLKWLEHLAQQKQIPLTQVPRIQLDQQLRTTQHQGIAAQLPELRYADPEAPFELAEARGEALLLVLLDQISDPRNYGAIIRSAEVLGAHGVVTEERRSAPLSPVVTKASAGASSHLPLVQVKNLPRYMDELKTRNVWLYGAMADAPQLPSEVDWQRSAALVIGSEGSGMRRLVRDKCDDTIKIPMRGKVGSLNASVAAGILIYEIVRGRSQASSTRS